MRKRIGAGAAALAIICGLGAGPGVDTALAKSRGHKAYRHRHHVVTALPPARSQAEAVEHPRVAERFAALQVPDLGAEMTAQAGEAARRDQLRQALEARAQAIAVAGPESTGSLPPAAAAETQPRSVSFDFESGLKTTTFPDRIVREGFDVAAAKTLASPPAAAGLLPPKP
jgi:hypothetical protein